MDNMDKVIKDFINEYFDTCFEAFIAPHMRKNCGTLFPELEKSLCLEHYNIIHKTNLNENDIELNSTECWVCKQIKDRP